MIPQEFTYASPRTLSEALGLIASGGKPLAGGHSLIPLMKLRLAAPEQLVDLRRIAGLNRIEERGEELHIGAMATHYELESSALVRGRCPLLSETAAHIGDVQVRNRGTIGGSVAHADPAADYPAALFALEARMLLRSASGERTVAVADFFVEALTTALEPGEIVEEVIVPCENQGTGVAYQKMEQPASGFAIVGVAARIRKSAGRLTMVRVGVTGLAGKPYRATAVEAALEGTYGGEDDIERAARAADEGADALSDLHASAAYRRHLARVYTARALRTALARSA